VSSEGRLTYQQGQRKKGNPERFTLLNRVPFGKFNRVNSEPVNAYDYNIIHLMPFLVNYHRQRRWLDKEYLEGTLVKT